MKHTYIVIPSFPITNSIFQFEQKCEFIIEKLAQFILTSYTWWEAILQFGWWHKGAMAVIQEITEGLYQLRKTCVCFQHCHAKEK